MEITISWIQLYPDGYGCIHRTDTRRGGVYLSGTDTRRVGGELYQGLIQEGVEITISGTDTRRDGDNYIRDGYKVGWR